MCLFSGVYQHVVALTCKSIQWFLTHFDNKIFFSLNENVDFILDKICVFCYAQHFFLFKQIKHKVFLLLQADCSVFHFCKYIIVII